MVFQGPQDLQDFKVWVSRALQDLQDQLDLLVLQEQLVLPEVLDLQVRQVPLMGVVVLMNVSITTGGARKLVSTHTIATIAHA